MFPLGIERQQMTFRGHSEAFPSPGWTTPKTEEEKQTKKKPGLNLSDTLLTKEGK